MNVYILHNLMFCSKICANNFFEYQQDAKDIKKAKLRNISKNKIINLLLEREECECCGIPFVEIEQEVRAKKK